MSIPLDEGFLRRACPSCQREFKWHYGPTDDRPASFVDPPVYFCPYCGNSAPPDQWWTEGQREHALQVTGSHAGEIIRELLDDSPFIVRSSDDGPEPPSPLIEPHDMVTVQSPCHPWEPIKVLEDWNDPLHCLLCGLPFAV